MGTTQRKDGGEEVACCQGKLSIKTQTTSEISPDWHDTKLSWKPNKVNMSPNTGHGTEHVSPLGLTQSQQDTDEHGRNNDADAWPFAHSKRHGSNAVQN